MSGPPDPATVVSARHLASGLAARTGVAACVLFDALAYVPENMLSLLDYPEGWSALAEVVAADLGMGPVGFRPTVH